MDIYCTKIVLEKEGRLEVVRKVGLGNMNEGRDEFTEVNDENGKVFCVSVWIRNTRTS